MTSKTVYGSLHRITDTKTMVLNHKSQIVNFVLVKLELNQERYQIASYSKALVLQYITTFLIIQYT